MKIQFTQEVYVRNATLGCAKKGTPEYANRTNKRKEASEAKKEEKRNKLLNWQLEIAKAVVPDLEPYSDLSETVEYIIKNVLTEKRGNIIIARYKDGKTYREIGREFSLTPEGIRQNVLRGIRILRRVDSQVLLQNGLEAIKKKEEEIKKEEEAIKKLEENYINSVINTAQEIDICHWGLCTRAINCLKIKNFNTVGDVLKFLIDGHSLREIRLIGEKTENNIMEKIKTTYGELFERD